MATTSSSATTSNDVKDLLEQVRELERHGRLLEALDALKAAERGDAAIDSRLISLRHKAFAHLDRSRGRDPWPPLITDRFPDERSLPEVNVGELDAEVLGSAILHHGALLVRGLLRPEQVELLTGDIDRAFDGRVAASNGASIEETRPWYERFLPGVGKSDTYAAGNHVRTADSPRTLNDLLEILEEVELTEHIGNYFGERPTLSANKSELRRVDPEVGPPDYHQDGAFLGAGIRTVNVWLALSDCGVDAPGLDLVPQRVDHIVETGADGAVFHWTVAPDTLARDLGDPPVIRPEFARGDALLFDHYLVHRTANRSDLPNKRYAIETWFFAPSAYPLPKEGDRSTRPHLPIVS